MHIKILRDSSFVGGEEEEGHGCMKVAISQRDNKRRKPERWVKNGPSSSEVTQVPFSYFRHFLRSSSFSLVSKVHSISK